MMDGQGSSLAKGKRYPEALKRKCRVLWESGEYDTDKRIAEAAGCPDCVKAISVWRLSEKWGERYASGDVEGEGEKMEGVSSSAITGGPSDTAESDLGGLIQELRRRVRERLNDPRSLKASEVTGLVASVEKLVWLEAQIGVVADAEAGEMRRLWGMVGGILDAVQDVALCVAGESVFLPVSKLDVASFDVTFWFNSFADALKGEFKRCEAEVRAGKIEEYLADLRKRTDDVDRGRAAESGIYEEAAGGVRLLCRTKKDWRLHRRGPCCDVAEKKAKEDMELATFLHWTRFHTTYGPKTLEGVQAGCTGGDMEVGPGGEDLCTGLVQSDKAGVEAGRGEAGDGDAGGEGDTAQAARSSDNVADMKAGLDAKYGGDKSAKNANAYDRAIIEERAQEDGERRFKAALGGNVREPWEDV